MIPFLISRLPRRIQLVQVALRLLRLGAVPVVIIYKAILHNNKPGNGAGIFYILTVIVLRLKSYMPDVSISLASHSLPPLMCIVEYT